MKSLEDLILIMDKLRDPQTGCPWDIKQDFVSIAPHTIEEAYEVADAIERGDMGHLSEELGDLLFQVVFYARLGKEQGLFDFSDIAQAIADKLIRRHPHVFPGGCIENSGKNQSIDAEQVVRQWDEIKAAERAGKTSNESLMDDVPAAMPALLRAAKLQKRAASAGFDWKSTQQVIEKLNEEMIELNEALAEQDAAAVEEELSDVIFTVVNISRHLGYNPETVLRKGNRKFENRFRTMEVLATAQGSKFDALTIDEQEVLWQEAKKTKPE